MTARSPLFGIYEKALPAARGWEAMLACAGDAGFAFVELAIDDNEERLGRLDWSNVQRAELRAAIARCEVPVRTLILSAHRRFPLGSADKITRQQALEIFGKAIGLAVDVGARVIQLAGYFVYYEPRRSGERERFLDGLQNGVDAAASAGVMLGLETMDGEDVTTVAEAMEIVRTINSPWLQVYPDVGNLAANGIDVSEDLVAGAGHLVGVHLKDTKPGEYRRVPFGEGIVPFGDVFRTLDRIGYDGPFVVEMWNEAEIDPFRTIGNARNWLEQQMREAGLQ